LKFCGYYGTESEISAVIRRLDVDGDNKVSLTEFIDGMKPSSASGGQEGSSGGFSSSKYEEEKKYSGSPLRRMERSPARES